MLSGSEQNINFSSRKKCGLIHVHHAEETMNPDKVQPCVMHADKSADNFYVKIVISVISVISSNLCLIKESLPDNFMARVLKFPNYCYSLPQVLGT